MRERERQSTGLPRRCLFFTLQSSMLIMLYHAIFTAALLFTTTHASPLQANFLSTRGVAFRPPPSLQCFTTSSINFAPLADCVGAVKSLPETPENSTFHNGPSYNEYNLDFADHIPKAFNGVCAIHVSLVLSPSTEEASWKEVKDSTQRIVDKCVRSREGKDVTGGYAYVGSKRGILVSVRLEEDRGSVPIVAVIPSGDIDGGRPYPPDEPFTNIG